MVSDKGCPNGPSLIYPISFNGIPSGIGEVAFHVPFEAEGHCK
jgi:hypothetical protein